MTCYELEFLPLTYGDGSPVEAPTAEDFHVFAHEHGRNSQDEPIRYAEELASTWGIYDWVFWAGYYGDPMPEVIP